MYHGTQCIGVRYDLRCELLEGGLGLISIRIVMQKKKKTNKKDHKFNHKDNDNNSNNDNRNNSSIDKMIWIAII